MSRTGRVILTAVLAVILLGIEVVIVRSASDYEPVSSVLYARQPIPAGTVMKAEMLEEREIGLSMVHRQSIRSVGEALGKRTRLDIEAGEMLLSSKLGQKEEMEQIRAQDANNRIFTVEFQADQANGWWLLVDQRVDILFVPNERAGLQSTASPEGTHGMLEAQIPGLYRNNGLLRLRNIRIAALIDEKGKLLKNEERSIPPRFVAFEVTDRQDEFLAYAKGSGRLEISVIPERKK